MPNTALHRALAKNTLLENRVHKIEQVNQGQATKINDLEWRTMKLEEWREKIARDLGQNLGELLIGIVERVERVERHCGIQPSSK